MNDTIVALSSGAPPAAIAVLRVSGPSAIAAVERLAGTLPPPREARLRRLRNDGETIDNALVLVFPGPASATGEDLVELHLHGGLAVVRAIEIALTSSPGVRRAEPGEFTRRALTNGRIDLTQAEALADLLAAETEAQRRGAALVADGMLRRNIDAFERDLLAIAARVELLLDFDDEFDAGTFALANVRDDIGALERRLRLWLAQPTSGPLHRGFNVVLAGRPNVGKSTLMNVLAGRDAAIVSPIAGTTRDRIEQRVVHDGVPITLIDTAGLTEDRFDPIEAIGVERAHQAIAMADVLLWLDDAAPPPRVDALWLFARADLPGREIAPAGRVAVSAQSGEGIERLWRAMHERLARKLPPLDGTALNDRQHVEMREAATALGDARGTSDMILVAEHLRAARSAFDRVTGRSGTEAMLDALFGRFCIGK